MKWCYTGKHTKEVEEERKDALEVAQEAKEEAQARAEEESRRAVTNSAFPWRCEAAPLILFD